MQSFDQGLVGQKADPGNCPLADLSGSRATTAECSGADPENRLLWKMNRRRLDFESLRDAILSVSGKLDAKVGGPSVALDAAPYTTRRTLYAFIDRQNLPGVFRTFDFASPDAHLPQRLIRRSRNKRCIL